MKKSVKINVTDFNKLVKKQKRACPFKKIMSFFRYNYRYNRNTFIALTSFILIFVIGLSISVYMSFARVGFNQNVVQAGDIATDPYYSKLTGIDYKDNDIYNSDATEATDFTSGTGTQLDPYIITTPGQLKYLSDSVNTEGGTYIEKIDKYVRTSDESIECFSNEDSVYIEQGNYSDWGPDYYNFTNNSGETLLKLYLKIYTDKDVYNFVGNNAPVGTTFNFTRSEKNQNGDYEINLEISTNLETGKTLNINMQYNQVYNDLKYRHFLADFSAIGESEKVFLRTGACKTIQVDVTKYYSAIDTRNVYFKLGNNIDMTGLELTPIGSERFAFEGNFDGANYKIKGLSISDNTTSSDHYFGLFGNVKNATIKNINLVNATMEVNGTGVVSAGMIVGKASGNSKIYNIGILSGSVNCLKNTSAKGYIGSVVGFVTDRTVVANSYSYANISSNSSGNSKTYFGGIVGYRDSNSNTIFEGPVLYLLVYYGTMNVSGSKEARFVYTGGKILASKSPNYCYYLWRGYTNDTSQSVSDTYAIMKSYDDMEGGGFDAHLNNYRYMVDYLVGNSNSIITTSTTGYSDISVWKIDLHRGYYPTLQQYSNSYRYDDALIVNSASQATGDKFKNGYIKVNIINDKNNSQNTVKYIAITNKDESVNDFTNKKIYLPFNKQHIGLTYSSDGKQGNDYMTLSGWKLTSVVQNGTKYSTQVNPSSLNFNYAKRSGDYSASKDVGNVYAQGGYYLVPDGVTEITITAYWATALYLKDATNDVVYNTDYSNNGNDSSRYGTATNPSAVNHTGSISPTSPCYDWNNVIEHMNNWGQNDPGKHKTVYDTVLVLVGNFHYNPNVSANTGGIRNTSFGTINIPFTISSVDNDGDLAPDYSFYTRNNNIQTMSSLRLDFVNFLSIPQVGTINSKLNSFELANNSTFEITETAHTDRIDIRHSDASYVKINGGFVSLSYCYDAVEKSRKKNYILVGGTAKALYVNAGVESRSTAVTGANEIPVFVITGGRIETLSSTYLGTSISGTNDVFFYIDGGYIDKFYTTYNASLNRRANVEVNGSYINTFYSGGHADSAQIKNGVRVDIKKSRIGTFYGGPEYGSISDGSVLTIRSSTIDSFFGGGYGGTNTVEVNLVTNTSDASCGETNYYYQISNCTNSAVNLDPNERTKSYCFGRKDETYGIQTGFYASIYSISGCAADAYSEHYSSLSAAKVDNVYVDIKDSTINKDFYGGGNKGVVEGNVVVRMYNTTVKGNVYGGGLSNENETVDVYENANMRNPNFISYTVDSQAGYPSSVTYTWDDSESLESSLIDTSNKLIYSPNVSSLGNVKENVILDIKKSTIGKSLYGGGNRSKVIGNVYVNLLGENNIDTVYGGGNKASVDGNVDLRVRKLTAENVYAGANESSVGGAAIVDIYDGSNITNVYGGGNKSDSESSTVYLSGGEIKNVYGGSNSDGIVEESHVYVGKYVDSEEEHGTAIIENLLKSYDYQYGGASSTSESDAVPCVGSYMDVMFEPLYRTESGVAYAIHLKMTNNTSRDFVKWSVTYKTNNTTGGPTSGWIGARVSYNASTKETTLTSDTQDGYSNAIWYSGQTMEWNNAYSDLLYTLNPGETVIDISDLSIVAYDQYGNQYVNGSCAEIASQAGSGNPTVPTKNVNDSDFDVPEIDTSKTPTVTNVYGGNNHGGETDITNVYLIKGTVTNVYGGGNEATSGYTNVYLNDVVTIPGDIYGGGNNGIVKFDTLISCPSCTVDGSIFGGGNGSAATVLGDTHVNISGNAKIGEDVFGSGNKAASGNISNTANTYVNIAGGTIGGSVYGGAKTSIVTGNTHVNIGYDDENMEKTDISIGGTVFGGGDSKESSVEYTYDFISVEGTISIVVEPMGGKDITIGGSIFGSGNRSSSSGDSSIILRNFGTSDDVKVLASIQRTSKLLLDNSYVELTGAKDSENNYSDYLFSLSRVKQFNIANNSVFYMRERTNIVGEINSLLITGNTYTYAKVDIDPETQTVTKNVDNKMYISPNRNFNVTESSSTENASWGNVNGMTYLGIYKRYTSGGINTGYYNDTHTFGDTLSNAEAIPFENGVVVKGLYNTTEGYELDGFYTTMVDDDTLKVSIDYINPISEGSYYSWSIGERSYTYQVWLYASRFATYGTGEVSLDDFYYPNTKFDIIAYNDSDLADGVKLVDPSEVPRVAASDEDALKTFGLTMKQSVTGWKTDSETVFKTVEGANGVVSGDRKYETASTLSVPVLDFHLTHSKNITDNKDIGTVLISLRANAQTDELTTSISRLYIEVIISAKNYKDDYYEVNMTPGKQYDIFSNKETKISADSSFSAFYSLYSRKKDEDGNYVSVFKNGSYRVLLSTYKLPVNTRITMVDRTNPDDPVYYYYVVTQDDYDNIMSEEGTTVSGSTGTYYIYRISNFIRMGSISDNNLFDDAKANSNNYDSSTGVSAEDYIFIVDFSESNITENVTNAEFQIQLKDSQGDYIVKMMPEERTHSKYDLYVNSKANIDITINPDKDTAYVGFDLNLTTKLNLEQQKLANGVTIYDTNYIQDRMGIMLSLYGSDGTKVTGTNLLGTLFYIDDKAFSANLDGSVRMKVSDFVTNVEKNIRIDLSKSTLSTDKYTIVVEAFGSPDGYYLGLTPSCSGELEINVVNSQYGLNIETNDEEVIVDSAEGTNLLGTNISKFNIGYSSKFSNPSLRFSLARREYNEKESNVYLPVDLSQYVYNELTTTSEQYIYLLTNNPQDTNELALEFKNKLPTGTYKLIVGVYNDDSLIGEDYEFVFIK